MDESILYPNVIVRPDPPEWPEGEERERLAANPQEMLRYSMAWRSKLPEDLHRSMILWSFDPRWSQCASFYFQWIQIFKKQPKVSVVSVLKQFVSNMKGISSWKSCKN